MTVSSYNFQAFHGHLAHFRSSGCWEKKHDAGVENVDAHQHRVQFTSYLKKNKFSILFDKATFCMKTFCKLLWSTKRLNKVINFKAETENLGPVIGLDHICEHCVCPTKKVKKDHVVSK